METVTRGLVVDLDSILDTRTATLMEMLDDDVHSQLLKEGYVKRIYDRSDLYDYERYLEKYANRDESTLARSFITNIPDIMGKEISRMTTESLGSPVTISPRIIINTYRYDIPGNILKGIREAVRKRSNMVVGEVVTVSIHPDAITPEWIESNDVSHMYMYDGWDWVMKTFSENHKNIPLVTLFLPMIITPEHKDWTAMFKESKEPNPFEQFELLFSPRIGSVFIAAEHWCNQIILRSANVFGG